MLEVSPTTTFPFASKATPLGRKNDASLPLPSANAPAPLPASVVTAPPGVTLRIRLFAVSATTMVPLASMATP